jgi:hypothetical protein
MTVQYLPLIGLALADALMAAGLAPAGVARQDYCETHVYWWSTTPRWEPWRSWDAVAHLLERFGMELRCHECWEVSTLDSDYVRHYERVALFREVPAAIGRLALRVVARPAGGAA